MANPWDNDPVVGAPTTAKKAQPRKYAPEAAKAALIKSDAVMNEGLKKLSAPQRKKALATYYSSPTIQRLRENAGLPAVRTRTEELADVARKRFRQEKALRPEGSFGGASRAASERAAFGIPERIGAALNYYGGVADPSVKSYDEQLQVERMVTDLQKDRSTGGNVFGTLAGGVAAGGAASKAVQLAGRGVAAVPGGAAVGNFIQRLTQLTPGARGANAAKIVTGGAAGGAAQAGGEGSDVATGAVTGAIAAPLVVGGIKGLEWASRPIRDFLRLSGAKGILGRFTSTTAEELGERAARFRAETGAEPTVFELLPEADRSSIQKMIKKMPGGPRERVTQAVRGRVGNMPRELVERTQEATAPQQQFMARQIARDLAESRGASNPTADELALARRAVRDPTEMEQVRRSVNANIMGPLDERIAFENVDELIPTNPVNQGNGRIVEEVSDPQIAATIRGAAGTLRLRPDGVRVQDVTRLVSRLRQTADRGGIEGDAAQSAINHIEDTMAVRHPDVAEAMARMNGAYASRSRMLEAVPEGRATRLREDVPVADGLAARGVRQAYDTPEGAAGRAIGQRAELLTDFAGTPNQAISRAAQISESPGVQEAIARNLGPDASQAIEQASTAQGESLRNLSGLRQPVKGEDSDMDFGDLAMTMSLLSPTSLVRTKSAAVGSILRFLSGIPEGRANQIVDALFSQNPAQMANAMRLLNSAGTNGARALRDIVSAVGIGAQAGGAAGGIDTGRPALDAESGAPTVEAPAPEAANPEAPWETDAVAEEGDGHGAPYGRAVIQSIYPDAVITDDERDPNSALGRKNPGSEHIMTDGAVDVRPIPGMTFDEFIAGIEAEGHEIIEAIDEVNHPSGHATGPHWHVVIA